MLTPASFFIVKSLLALAALCGLLVAVARRFRGKSGLGLTLPAPLAATLAAAGFLAWVNFGFFHLPWFVHVFDMYHYYVGAKYLPELGYLKLYECSALAQLESSVVGLPGGLSARDLSTNHVKPIAEILADPEECRSRFSPERWESFKADVAWFRARMSDTLWHRTLRDHGFNASPVWAVAGHALANAVPLSDRNAKALGSLDFVLLAAMWLLVWWAFGAPVAGVAMLFWGTNILGDYSMTGGSLLRFGWLANLVAGICFLKKGKNLAAGFFVASSALLRLFPAVVFFALFGKLVRSAIARKSLRLEPEERHLLLGGALALVPLLLAVAYFPVSSGIWEGFAANTRKHAQAVHLNDVSLSMLLAYDPALRGELLFDRRQPDPWHDWQHAQTATKTARRLPYYALVVLFLALLWKALARNPWWVCAIAGVGLIPVALPHVASYYLVVLLVYAFLWGKRTVLVLCLFALAHLLYLPNLVSDWPDQRYAITSLLVLAYVFGVVAHLAFRPESVDDGGRHAMADPPAGRTLAEPGSADG